MKQRLKKTSSKEDDLSLRDIDRKDIIDDSEYDEIILEKYDEDVTFIGWSILWSEGTVQFPTALKCSQGEHSLW